MSDLIDRQAAIDALLVAVEAVGILDEDDIRLVFDNLPSAQPERKKGKWIDLKHDDCYQCSCCKDIWMGIGGYRFCPNCSADMRGEQDETD